MVNLFLVEISVKLLIALSFTAISALILRAIVINIFKIKDKSFNTPLAIVIWVGFATIFASYLSKMPFLGWILIILANYFFVYLIKIEYKQTWKTSFKIWLVWFGINFIIGIVLVSLYVLVV